MQNLLRQPLLHFFALGGVLFVLFRLVGGDGSGDPAEIVVDANRVAALAMRFERTWQRPPTQEELQGVIDSWIREEVLYREGLAMGLDRDDPVVRGRVAQKTEFMFDSGVRPPADADLRAWFAAHPERYRQPPRYAFEQAFFDPGKHGPGLQAQLRDAVSQPGTDDPALSGDPTLLPARLELSSTPDIERVFGPEFAASLAAQPVGRWAGPVASSYGLHLVRIDRREPAQLPTLDEVRDAVARDLMQARTAQAKDDFYRALRARYTVRIDATPAAPRAAAVD